MIAVLLISAALCLVVSVATAVIGVNRQGQRTTLSAGEIGVYLTGSYLDAPELWRVQVRSLRTLQKATESAQQNADDALKSITVSLYALLGGLGFAVVSVGVSLGELI